MRIRRGPWGGAPSLLLAGLALSGCVGSGDDKGWVATYDTLESGVPRVTYQPPSDDAVASTFTEELRLGAMEGDGPAVFGRIKGLQVLPNGRIAVLDAMAREIRIFDPDGRHLATHGRQGEGPGEFQEPFGLMQDAAGRLWVPDFRAARMSEFDLTEGFIGSFGWKVLRYGFMWDGAMTEGDRILEPSITLEQPRRNILRVYDGTGLVDSLPLPDDPPVDRTDPPGAYYWEAPGGRAMGFVRIPGFPFGSRVFDREGAIWSTDHGDYGYRVKHWQPGGDTLLVLEVRRAPIVIPASERDSVIAALRAELQERGAANQDWSKVPQQRAAVASLFVSEEGHLWVESQRSPGTTVFDRYSPDGAYLGSVAGDLGLVSGIRPITRGDQLWAVVRDDLDVQYVVRFRLTTAPPAP